MRHPIYALLLAFGLAATTACAPVAAPPATPAPTGALATVERWTLQGATSADGQAIAAVRPDGRAVHALVFDDGDLAIEGGCNRMGAEYHVDAGGRLVVGMVRSTRMACASQALMAADQAVAGLVQGTSEWRIAESYPEQLFLDHADGRRTHWVAERQQR